MTHEDELFADQVQKVVRQIGYWIRQTQPKPDHLMPALAVVLGRLISHRSRTEHELESLLSMAMNAATSSAFEDWLEKKHSEKGHIQ